MRPLRVLQQGVWYEIRSRINNREPLFRRHKALAMFARVFRETGIRFVFEVRGLRLDGDLLSFYIKPEDGLELPEIMKWMKQVFAQRYNRAEGRTGHIWGDRYWSRIVEEEVVPQASREGKGHGISALLKFHGVRPRYDGRGRGAGFFLIFPHPAAPSPE